MTVIFTYIETESEGKVLLTQLCPTLSDSIDCSPPGSSVHRILQARILERVAISFFRGSSDPVIEPRSPMLQADSHMLSHLIMTTNL